MGSGTVHVTSRDAAKFGLLYLNDGVFDGKQVISSEWVHDSLQTYLLLLNSQSSGSAILWMYWASDSENDQIKVKQEEYLWKQLSKTISAHLV